MQTTVNEVLEFLSEQFMAGIGYSALNTCKSALSSFATLPGDQSISNHPLISRFVRGTFNMKPTRPRYKEIWNVGLVLNYLRGLSPTDELGLRDLTWKLCSLIAIISANRLQTLHMLRIDQMVITESTVEFFVTGLIKQSRPGHSGTKITLNSYPVDERICVVSVLKCYLKKTESLRGSEKQLFISHRRPHEKITKDTLARWIRNVLDKSGVDTAVFKPHSTRAASASAADQQNVPISDILATAGWATERTFQKFYNKPIQGRERFQSAVLMSCE